MGMHAPGPRVCCQCWRGCGRRQSQRLELLWLPREMPQNKLTARGDLRAREEAAAGVSGPCSGPAQSSGALSRRRRCRTSVSRLQPRRSGPGGSGPGKVGEGKTRDPAPPGTGCPPRLSKCVLPPRRVGDAAPTPRERLLGTGKLRLPLGPGA